jgi:hypothetical protein
MLFAAAEGTAQSREDAYRVEEFPVNGMVSLEVQTSGGSISVVGANENKVTVEMYVRKRGDIVKSGNADLDDFNIDISQDGNKVQAIAERTSSGINWGDNYSISFIVYTPEETRTRLHTSGGSVSARNLEGSQELRTSGGSVNVEGIRGQMVLKTSGGSISISDSQGDTEAHTSGGSINVDALSGNLVAKTSGGTISMKAMEGNVEAKTSGGSINADILAAGEAIDLRTSGGSINITVPEQNGYDLDLEGTRVDVDLENFSGKSERDEIKGTINGGGTLLKARTSGGTIRLRYQ